MKYTYKIEKIKSDKNLLKQVEKSNFSKNQIDTMKCYLSESCYNDDIIYLWSYDTIIGVYDKSINELKVTKRKYSTTTTRQQNKIINNFVKWNNTTVVYSDEI